MSFKFFLLFFVLVISPLSAYDVSDFKGGIFSWKPSDGLYEVNVGLDNAENDGDLLVAYADINADSYTDIITLSSDQGTFKIYVWNSDKNKFEFSQKMNLGKIASILPADLNHDGSIDLIITQEFDDNFLLTIYFQTDDKKFDFEDQDYKYAIQELTAKIQPTILDISGDHEANIMYTSLEGVRKIARYNPDSVIDDKFNITKFADYIQEKSNEYSQCLDFNSQQLKMISAPHFNSLVDYNGDCKADLILTSITDNKQTTNLEFYSYLNNGKFCLDKIIPVVDLQAMALSDVDFDGSIDLIYMSANEININFNQLSKDSNNLCRLDTSKFPFDMNSKEHVTTYKLSTFPNLQNYSLYQYSSTFPAMLRVNDVQADGYPDLLITVYDSKTNGNPKLMQFTNEDCSQDFCAGQHKKYFQYNENSEYKILENYQALWGAYFDFDISKGSLDYMITVKKNGNQKIISIFNYLNPDTFFLKALSTNGKNSYGGYYQGASFQCIVTTLSADSLISATTQQSQSGYTPLNLPYVFIGLGRTNNYVEEFHVGLPQKDEGTKSWTPIIPNSQLMIDPNTQSVSEWTIRIFVNPTKATIVIIISTLLILIILGSVIIYLHKKEKEEDKKSQESFYEMFR